MQVLADMCTGVIENEDFEVCKFKGKYGYLGIGIGRWHFVSILTAVELFFFFYDDRVRTFWSWSKPACALSM